MGSDFDCEKTSTMCESEHEITAKLKKTTYNIKIIINPVAIHVGGTKIKLDRAFESS